MNVTGVQTFALPISLQSISSNADVVGPVLFFAFRCSAQGYSEQENKYGDPFSCFHGLKFLIDQTQRVTEAPPLSHQAQPSTAPSGDSIDGPSLIPRQARSGWHITLELVARSELHFAVVVGRRS